MKINQPPQSPTVGELVVLLHWWLMVTSGAVLAVDGEAFCGTGEEFPYESPMWWAVPCREWHESWKIQE